MYAYIVMALPAGARTEELRALTWDHVDLLGKPDAEPPTPPHIAVWRSVRVGGDTKTRTSRRTLALPAKCVDALSEHSRHQVMSRDARRWTNNGTALVFCPATGGPLQAGNVRRAFRTALRGVDGVDPAKWTPRELRHSFVSLLSDSGVSIDQISRLIGHKTTLVTELVYRKQIRLVMQDGAVAMDGIFGTDRSPSHGVGHGTTERESPESPQSEQPGRDELR
jgi:integrase